MTVLVPVDGSGPARRAATVTFRESPDAEFLVLYVIDPYRAVVAGGLEDLDSSMDRAQADAETALRVIEDLATDAGVDIETEIGFGNPARVILEYAALDEIDRVVIGTHGRRGVGRALLGSVTERVVRRAPVPVTVVRDRESETHDAKFLLPVDGSPPSSGAGGARSVPRPRLRDANRRQCAESYLRWRDLPLLLNGVQARLRGDTRSVRHDQSGHLGRPRSPLTGR